MFKYLASLILYVSLVLAEASVQDIEEVAKSEEKLDSMVLEITEDNYDEILEQYDTLFIYFSQENCQYCVNLAPKIEEIAKQMAVKFPSPQMGVGRIMADQGQLVSKFKVRSFPSIKFYTENTWRDYEGRRDVKVLSDWISRRYYTLVPLLTCEELEAKAQTEKFMIVHMGAYGPSKYAEPFLKFAWNHDDFEYARVEDDCTNSYPVEEVPSLVFLRQFMPKFNTFEGRLTKTAIREWVLSLLFKKVFELDEEGMGRIGEGVMSIILFRSEEDSASELSKHYIELAESYKQKKLLWAYTNATVENVKLMALHAFGLQKHEFPALRIIDTSNFAKFKPNFNLNNATKTDIMKWYKRVQNEESKPYIKSQPIPAAETNILSVKHIVAKNYNIVVHQPNWDCLVLVYTPEVVNTEIFKMYEELANQFQVVSADNVQFFVIDGVLNEVQHMQKFIKEGEITDFPTILFYPAVEQEMEGQKKLPTGVKYEGAQTKEALTAFMNANAVNLQTNEEDLPPAPEEAQAEKKEAPKDEEVKQDL